MSLAVIYFFAVASVALIIISLAAFSKDKAKPRMPLPSEGGQGDKKTKILALISGIFPLTRVLLSRLKMEDKIKRALDTAHVKLSPQGYFNLKLLLIALLVTLVIFASGKADPIAISIPVIFGYLIPDMLLNIKVAKRRQAIIFALPETVDLLGLCVEGGLDFTAALKWIIEKTPHNCLIEEFIFLLEEIKLGKTRAQALKDMSKRLNLPEINFFVQTLVQSERMGASVAEAFKVISEDTRQLRFQRGERIALKAPIKILLPLIFFILPVIAIIVGGPLVLQFMQGQGLKGLAP